MAQIMQLKNLLYQYGDNCDSWFSVQVVQALLGFPVVVDSKDRGEAQVGTLMVLKVFLEVKGFLDFQVSLDHRAVHVSFCR